MKVARHVMIWVLSQLLVACSASPAICRGPLHPINVHAPSTQGSAP